MAIYDIDGNSLSADSSNASALDYDKFVKGIAHRGYSLTAPENTLPAYKLAKQMGFNYVEADICWTSDDVPVLSHDTTIDRCSDGSGTISAMTYEELLEYDFGSWFSDDYAGTTIPTGEEFLTLCKNLGLHPYLDLRNASESRFQILVDTVEACGMKGNVTYVSGTSNLTIINSLDSEARLGLIWNTTITSDTITTMQGYLTGSNEVFIDAYDYYITDEICTLCQEASMPLEIWTVDTASSIASMNAYITGVTSNNLIAGKVLYEANIE